MRLGSLLLLLCAVAAAPARADGVVYRASGCGEYIFVQAGETYSVLRTDSPITVKEGDNLRGDVERIGRHNLFNQNSGRAVFGQVTDRNLDRAEVARQIAVRCRSALAARPVSGSVTRAAGCGNKIFVTTPQGYVVLERISGGVIAEGDTLTGGIDRPGRATVLDQQSNTTFTVFVEDLWLSRSAAERKMAASCQRQR
jgi:hypothetical protein